MRLCSKKANFRGGEGRCNLSLQLFTYPTIFNSNQKKLDQIIIFSDYHDMENLTRKVIQLIIQFPVWYENYLQNFFSEIFKN